MAKDPQYLTHQGLAQLVAAQPNYLALVTNALTASEEAFPDTAQVLRSEPTADGAGGVTVEYQDAGTLACNLYRDQGAKTRVEGGKVAVVNPWLCAFPVGSDVRTPDRLVISGLTFEVVSTNQGMTYASNLVAQLVAIT